MPHPEFPEEFEDRDCPSDSNAAVPHNIVHALLRDAALKGWLQGFQSPDDAQRLALYVAAEKKQKGSGIAALAVADSAKTEKQ